MKRIKTYAKFIKLEHTLFSLPLIYSGAVLAQRGWPPVRIFLLVLLAGFGARTVAMALNRIIDRHFDALNPRTAGRELPAAALSAKEAWAVVILGLVLYLGAAWAIAPICLWLSPIPLGVFVVYPYMKRFTPWAHLGVGAGLALAPLGGWIAVTQTLEGVGPGLLLTLFTFFWVAGFDMIYSTADAEFDRSAGLKSLPAMRGVGGALMISAVFHLAAFFCLVGLQLTVLSGALSWAVLLGTGALLWLEHHKATDVHLAFFKINAVLGFVVLGWIVCGVA
ncbi:MAG: UbiA family prenyltransferase [Candidatus Omnitrophica bacterium]|nr:UbiA family prenyltransferase [Candidatus Omnitrophota bacterium]